MRIPIVPFAILIVVSLAIDTYIYLAAVRRCRSNVPARLQLFSAIALYLLLIVALCLPMREGDESTLLTKMWMLFGFMSTMVPKALFVIIDLLSSLPRLFGGHRCNWGSLTGGVLAIVLFLGMWWGALINRFTLDVREVEIAIPRLPSEFEGYRIVQISDLHVGTYGHDDGFLRQLVNTVNDLEPDLIVFTGDIVNRRTDELRPFTEVLSKLYAPDGVYSIMGNHDYGDYYNWENDAAKQQNLEEMKRLQAEMGWRLLLNEHEYIYQGHDSIAIVGVENVGDPPFTVYGDLQKAYPGLSDMNTKILLSHNPAHWSMDIAETTDKNIALTLSGHTHAMQIELAGLSPAAFRYKNWGGLYEDELGLHQLYVNIGVGTVGMPMRLGATPEITVLTLARKRL